MTFYIHFEHSIAVTARDAHKYILYAICTVPYLLSIATLTVSGLHFISSRLLAEVEVSNMKTVNLSNYALTT